MADGMCTQGGFFSFRLGHSSTKNGTRYRVSMTAAARPALRPLAYRAARKHAPPSLVPARASVQKRRSVRVRSREAIHSRKEKQNGLLRYISEIIIYGILLSWSRGSDFHFLAEKRSLDITHLPGPPRCLTWPS